MDEDVFVRPIPGDRGALPSIGLASSFDGLRVRTCIRVADDERVRAEPDRLDEGPHLRRAQRAVQADAATQQTHPSPRPAHSVSVPNVPYLSTKVATGHVPRAQK